MKNIPKLIYKARISLVPLIMKLIIKGIRYRFVNIGLSRFWYKNVLKNCNFVMTTVVDKYLLIEELTSMVESVVSDS